MLAEDARASKSRIWGFPKIGVPSWGGVPIIWIMIFWALYFWLPILGNYHIISSGNTLMKNSLYSREPTQGDQNISYDLNS